MKCCGLGLGGRRFSVFVLSFWLGLSLSFVILFSYSDLSVVLLLLTSLPSALIQFGLYPIHRTLVFILPANLQPRAKVEFTRPSGVPYTHFSRRVYRSAILSTSIEKESVECG
jgi:hypothetical protein